MIRFLRITSIGLLKAMFYLIRYRPHAIFATGGFVSAPTVFAAAMISKLHILGRRIPIYLFEPNAEPGKMNAMAVAVADRIAVVSESAKRFLASPNVVLEGYPVRWNKTALPRQQARDLLRLPQSAKVLLVFGGSMGARSLNRAMVEAWTELRKDPNLYVLLAVGRRKSSDYDAEADTEEIAQAFGIERDERFRRVVTFEDMAIPYSACDIAITRAGAGSIAEICELGIPSILVPKSNLPGDHQAANAVEMQMSGASAALFESSRMNEDGSIEEHIDVDRLVNSIFTILEDPNLAQRYSQRAFELARPSARRTIATNLMQLARTRKLPRPPESENAATKNKTDSPLGLSASRLRMKLERQIGFGWNDILPVKVLDDCRKPLPTRDKLESILAIDYYRYRGNIMLASSSWEACNEGIKLSAVCRDENSIPILASWITDRRPVGRLHRLLGGDFQSVGFLRRNATAAMGVFDCWSDEVCTALTTALDDPYWEVRVAAARAISRLPDHEALRWYYTNQIVERLHTEPHYETHAAYWITLGAIAPAPLPIELIDPDLLHPNDLIRTALLMALVKLEERGISLPSDLADTIRRDLLMTSNQFVPNFLLRRAAAHFEASQKGNA